MDHCLSTHLFINQRLTTALLDRLANAGLRKVEIFCARQHLDYQNKAQVNEIAEWFKDSPMELWAIHGPMYSDDCNGQTGPNAVVSITERVKSKRVLMVDEIKRALEIAERIPCQHMVQHLGVGGEEFSEHAMDAAFTSLDELNLFARARGVEVLLENIPNGLSNAEKLEYFLGITHLRNGYCFDVGHAHLYGTKIGASAAHEFDIMKARIRSTHVHGNNGALDNHRFPMIHADDSVDWRAIMRRFRACGDQFPLNLEVKEAADIEQPLEKVKEVFDKLEGINTDE